MIGHMNHTTRWPSKPKKKIKKFTLAEEAGPKLNQADKIILKKSRLNESLDIIDVIWQPGTTLNQKLTQNKKKVKKKASEDKII